MSPHDAALRFGVSRQAIMQWIKKGWLPATKDSHGKWQVDSTTTLQQVRAKRTSDILKPKQFTPISTKR